MPERLPEAGQWYGGDDMVKKVGIRGTIRKDGVVWKIGEAFGGEEVALRRMGEDRHEVYYCWKKLGVLDSTTCRKRGDTPIGTLTERVMARSRKAETQPST
jgi:hypothetical protein